MNVSKCAQSGGEEGRFVTHSRLVAVESATERAALLCASTSMAPPLILSTSCECESSATPPGISVLEFCEERTWSSRALVFRTSQKK